MTGVNSIFNDYEHIGQKKKIIEKSKENQESDVWSQETSNFFLIFLHIYLFLRDRERQSMSRGGAEREGHTEFEAGCRLRAVSTEPNTGPELTNRKIMS